MDTTPSRELASEVGELRRKIDEIYDPAACHPNPRLFCNAM
jgi:hypothetical protein